MQTNRDKKIAQKSHWLKCMMLHRKQQKLFPKNTINCVFKDVWKGKRIKTF